MNFTKQWFKGWLGYLKPDLIILDIMLPFKDGWQVAKEIRLTMNTPIIMHSAKGEESDKILGLNLGGDDDLLKIALTLATISPGEKGIVT